MFSFLLYDFKKLWSMCIIFVFCLTIVNLIIRYMYFYYSDFTMPYNIINVDSEFNIPAFYSTLIILINSFLLYLTGKFGLTDKKYWYFLSIVFVFLAFDELCTVHERTIVYAKAFSGGYTFLHFSWVIPAIAFLVVLAIILTRFVFRLPLKTRLHFILAGLVFIVGAVGLEMVGGHQAATNGGGNFTYGFITVIEELLEMLGMLLFMNYLIIHLKSVLEEGNKEDKF